MPRSYWGYWFHPVITWPFVDVVQENVICHFSLVLTPMISKSKVYIRFNDNVIISCDIGSTTRQFQEQWNINDRIIRRQQKSWWWKGWFLKRSMMPTGNSYWTYSDLFSSRCKEMQSFSSHSNKHVYQSRSKWMTRISMTTSEKKDKKNIILLSLGWQQRIVSLMTTARPLVRLSRSEESRSLEAQW